MMNLYDGQVLAFSKSLRAFSPSYRMKADPIQHKLCALIPGSWCAEKMDSQILEQVKKRAQEWTQLNLKSQPRHQAGKM